MNLENGQIRMIKAPPVTPEGLYEQDKRRRELDEKEIGTSRYLRESGFDTVEGGWYEAHNPPGRPKPVKVIKAESPKATVAVDEVEEYLDRAIRMWREKRDRSEKGGPDWTEAICYVDAFQSARLSLLGMLLIDA